MKEFEKFGLSQEILNALKNMNITSPTEIQERAIPIVLKGKDIKGGSATGSGKTLVFAIPIIEKLRPENKVQALILTPTRELAEQVALSIKRFSGNKRLNVLAVYGGVSIEDQIKKITSSDVIVGTPGRIIDHLDRKTIRLNNVKFLVLDEVDRMFDMGFLEDVEKILKHCPDERQTMLFSATISPDIDHLAQKYTKNPVNVSVCSYVDPSKLKQFYYDVETNMKLSLLVHLLNKEKTGVFMVFCSTRKTVDFVCENMKRLGIQAQAIHGGLSQNQRNNVMEKFKKNRFLVLICTDVAARGLHIKGVTYIINYDMPKTPEEYIHRIGRTARAGGQGVAISIVCNRDYENFNKILKNENLKITNERLPFIKKIFIKRDFNKNKNRPHRTADRSKNFSFKKNYRNNKNKS